MCCRGLHGFADPAYLSRFVFSGLLRVASHCRPGGIRVVSGRATATVRQQVQWQALATFGATIRRHRFLGVAVGYRIGVSKPISLLVVARCFCVLRPSGVRWHQPFPTPSVRRRSSLCGSQNNSGRDIYKPPPAGCSSTSISMSAWESIRMPSLRKAASCSIIALRNSSESPILSSSAIVLRSFLLGCLVTSDRNHTVVVLLLNSCDSYTLLGTLPGV
jgi:hypothetical protein